MKNILKNGKMDHLSDSNRKTGKILKNTLMLYFREILILLVSLYTVRVVLNTLGAEDYGIYNVVAGVVTMFSFLSGAMASATQRFFSFALGENNQKKLNETFSVNLIIYLGIAIVAVVLLETVGLWFVYNKLKIPFERFDSAIFIYHFSVFSFLFSIITSPFMAIIIAHEDMQLYAFISIIEAVLKLVIAFILPIILFDKLKIYGILLFAVALINACIYLFTCLKKYSECQFKHFYWSKTQFKEIFNFTGWTLFGQFTTVGRTQAVTILVNQFFNPLVVSARAIAMQVSHCINIFSSNFNTGLYPSIIKTYAANEKDEMFKLVYNGCKLCFFLMWILALPLFIEMDFVLTLWLKNPPENVVLFTRLALIEVVINTISSPIATAARAPGKMKTYELTLGSIQILIFIADYFLFKFFNVPAYFVFIVAAIANFIMLVIRVIIVKFLINLSLRRFLKSVLIPIALIITISFCLSYWFDSLLDDSFGFVILCCFFTLIINLVCMAFIGLKKEQRKKLFEIVVQKFLIRGAR